MEMSYNKDLKIENEMMYQSTRLDKPIILSQGVLNGQFYIILNLGTHPCAYIKIPKDSKLNKIKRYDLIPLRCHGGITFFNKLKNIDIENNYIGWDYSHAGDYSGYMPYESEKRWTTKEIIDEVWSVTYDLKKLREFINELFDSEVFEKYETN